MDTLRAVVTLALKDLRLLARDRAAVFFVLVFPLVFVLFFGTITGGAGEGQATMDVAVVDRDSSDASRALVERLRAEEALRVRSLGGDAAREAVRRGELAGYVAVESGYGEAMSSFGAPPDTLLEVGTDPGRRAVAGLLEGIVVEAASARMSERFTDPAAVREQLEEIRGGAPGDTVLPPDQRRALEDVLASVERFMEEADTAALSGGSPFRPPSVRRVRVAAPAERPRSSFAITFPQAILWGIMACVATFAASLVRERQAGTLLRLRAAPLSLGAILAAKAVACFGAIVVVSTFLVALGAVVFGVRVVEPGLLALAIGGVGTGFVGVMMLLATLGRTEQAVSGASWAVLLVMAMIGGGMIPLVAMPDWMRTVGHVSPVKWGILAVEGAIWRGFDLAEMSLPLGVLLGIGLASFGLGVLVFSRRGYVSD